MNSQNLKTKFPKIYRDFYCKCERVVSSPHVFFWTGDFSVFYGGLAVCSKIPLRFYVGLEKISKDKVEISEEFYAYFPSQNAFSKIRFDDYIINSLKDNLSSDLKGYRLNFLSEIPLGVSLGGLGALSACLGTLIAKDITKAESLAIKFSSVLQRGRKSSAAALTSLCQSSYPLVYSQDKNKPRVLFLDKMLHLPSKAAWPIDFGLIFTGKLVQGSAVISSSEEMERVSKDLQNQAGELLGGYKGDFWKDYLSMLNHVACQSLVAIKDLFNSGSSDKNLSFFFATLNQYQNLLHFLGISTPQINEIYSTVHKLANNLEGRPGSGAKISGVGRGGEVLFAMPYGEARKKIELASIDLAKKNDSRDFLDYASWRDGLETRGAILEQDIKKSIFSDFIKKGMYRIDVFDSGESYSKIITKNEIDKLSPALILDSDRKKLIYKGKSPDSSKIFSQKATVEILGALLQKKDNKIFNSDLPVSYGKSRFDLQSKIIKPLSKLTGLEFEISGGMYDDFTCQLKPFDLTIIVLKKIN